MVKRKFAFQLTLAVKAEISFPDRGPEPNPVKIADKISNLAIEYGYDGCGALKLALGSIVQDAVATHFWNSVMVNPRSRTPTPEGVVCLIELEVDRPTVEPVPLDAPAGG